MIKFLYRNKKSGKDNVGRVPQQGFNTCQIRVKTNSQSAVGFTPGDSLLLTFPEPYRFRLPLQNLVFFDRRPCTCLYFIGIC